MGIPPRGQADESGEGLQCRVLLLTVEARPDGWRVTEPEDVRPSAG
jgi:hypothetical protein